jgi:type II secretory pathway component PulK
MALPQNVPIKASSSPAPVLAPVYNAVGKGSQQQVLPSRHALNTLTRGDVVNRSLGNYAKNTPGPDNAGGIPGSIFGMGS